MAKAFLIFLTSLLSAARSPDASLSSPRRRDSIGDNVQLQGLTRCEPGSPSARGRRRELSRLLAIGIILQATFHPALGAGEATLAGLCLPGFTRYTKCTGGKIAECVRKRGFNCKTKHSCVETQQPCDPPDMVR
jgi:hypothetical protein